MSFVTATYDFSTELTAPPVATQIRFNAGHPYTAVTSVWVRNLTATGVDVHVVLMAIPSGTTLYIQDKNDHTLFAHFDTTGPAVDASGYVTLPVTWVANGAALVQQEVTLLVVTDAATLPPPIGGPPVVALEAAKLHLRITDTDHDTDIAVKLAQATDAIRDYLGDAADPAWDLDTVPDRVAAAILLYLAELYEHRGDDLSPDDFDAGVWDAIRRLLMRTRDPVVA